jgi:hypothetical protein
MTSTTLSQSSLDRSALEQAIQVALEQARSLTEVQGINSLDAIVAWDAVEELLAEKSHRQQHTDIGLEKLCTEFPHRSECLIYDV